MKNGYICVYDSGIGGLTTLNEIMKILPNEKYIYFADDKDVKLSFIMLCLLLAGLFFPVCLGGLIARIFDKMNE